MLANTVFWRYARAFGLPLVHTVHNVMPHEPGPRDRERAERVYGSSRALIVHSRHARDELEQAFPFTRGRTIIEPLGAYSSYPRAALDRKTVRMRLAIPDGAIVVLAFGWVRPYKNIESLIRALDDARTRPVVLVIAGRETGYADQSPAPDDLLGRVRAVAADAGVADRVRFIPGFTDAQETADLVAASDIMALPYFESWGSGQLVLAMTMGRYVLATATGGMDEYMAKYPAHTLVRGTTPSDIAVAIEEAVARLPSVTDADRQVPPEWTWPHIARDTIAALETIVPPGVGGRR
jgi:glycosyltransferase involved in cell wall biosynthesis